MTVLTETRHRGEFLVSEANGHRSREVVTMVSGTVALVAGSVLGKITASGKYNAYDSANVDGSEDAAAILFDDCDASGGDVECLVILRDAEFNLGAVIWSETDTDEPAGIIALALLGVIGRVSTNDSVAPAS